LSRALAIEVPTVSESRSRRVTTSLSMGHITNLSCADRIPSGLSVMEGSIGVRQVTPISTIPDAPAPQNTCPECVKMAHPNAVRRVIRPLWSARVRSTAPWSLRNVTV
jgi:hypothetical protein